MVIAMSAVSGAGGVISSSAAATSVRTASVFSARAPAAPFSDLVTDAVGQVSDLQDQANEAVRGLMSGSGVDVHQAMIATQKADMAFELALSVRNKAVQAYQSVMGMQF
jgi:flagellar hook-basal body complex protein FliE